jgi:hypothetical protein
VANPDSGGADSHWSCHGISGMEEAASQSGGAGSRNRVENKVPVSRVVIFHAASHPLPWLFGCVVRGEGFEPPTICV